MQLKNTPGGLTYLAPILSGIMFYQEPGEKAAVAIRGHARRRLDEVARTCGNLVSMTSFAKAASEEGRGQESRRPRMRQWQLQEAKARFSEVVRRAKQEGPQHVTIHGREEVVIVGADDFRRLAGAQSGRALVNALRTSPRLSTKIEAPRLPMPVRAVDL